MFRVLFPRELDCIRQEIDEDLRASIMRSKHASETDLEKAGWV